MLNTNWILIFISISGQEYKSALVALNKAIAGTSVDDFLEATENALDACGMILKKVDKKKDRWNIIKIKSIQTGFMDI